MNNNFTDEFKSAIREAGLTPPEVVKPRKCCRFPTNGDPRDDAGWCLLFADLQGGVFGDFRTGLYGHWQAKRNKPFTPAERDAFRQRCEQARKERDAEQQARYEAAALKAAEILSCCNRRSVDASLRRQEACSVR